MLPPIGYTKFEGVISAINGKVTRVLLFLYSEYQVCLTIIRLPSGRCRLNGLSLSIAQPVLVLGPRPSYFVHPSAPVPPFLFWFVDWLMV